MDNAMAVRLARTIALLTPLTLLIGAYISQYGFGLYPCEMCWWQRYAHFAALLLGLVAALRPFGDGILVKIAALAIAVAGLIGGWHAGIEYDWWEGLTHCSTMITSGSADPLDAIMNAPITRCDEAPWALFGISLAGWNFLFSMASALAILLLLTRTRWSIVA
jgi:disulfide bond formation protein DsbB